MDEAVLMHADVDERAKLGNVGDDALKDHVRLDVGELADGLGEAGSDKLIPRIAAGLSEFFEDVRDGEAAGRELLCVNPREKLRTLDEQVDGHVECLGDLLDHWVGFRVDGGAIEGVLPVADAKEAGGLLEGLRADAGNLVEL